MKTLLIVTVAINLLSCTSEQVQQLGQGSRNMTDYYQKRDAAAQKQTDTNCKTVPDGTGGYRTDCVGN